MKKYLLLIPFLLTSCMTIQVNNEVKQNADITYNAVVDMSGMVNMMNSLETGSIDSTTPKDLCTDSDITKSTLNTHYRDVSCTSLGDYKARMVATLPKSNNPGIWIGSGVIVFNPLWMKGIKPGSKGHETDVSMKEYGVVIEGTFHFPYPIVYTDGGFRLNNDTIILDMLDKNILKKRDLYIVARADGKKPTNTEVLKYKKLIRTEIIKAKKSGKYDDFEDMLGL